MHVVALSLLYDPTGHVTHTVLALYAYDPALHIMHADIFPVLYPPDGQLTHCDIPADPLYSPALQPWQLDALSVALTYPAEHVWHGVDALAVYDPLVHTVHAVCDDKLV